MTLDEIKTAVRAGRNVHWSHEGYRVIEDSTGQWLIAYRAGTSQENYIGLTWADGVTLNGLENQFYIAHDGFGAI